VKLCERQSLDEQAFQPVPPPLPKASRLERWLTILVFAGSSLVYLSLILKSFVVFAVGELACLLLAPVVLWLERAQIREWWSDRGKCTHCGFDLDAVKGPCPGCGAKRIVE